MVYCKSVACIIRIGFVLFSILFAHVSFVGELFVECVCYLSMCVFTVSADVSCVFGILVGVGDNRLIPPPWGFG